MFQAARIQEGCRIVHGGNDMRQLVIFVIDEVVEEDYRLLLASELESTTLQDRTSGSLSPAPRDVYITFEGPCLLENGERPHNTLPYNGLGAYG